MKKDISEKIISGQEISGKDISEKDVIQIRFTQKGSKNMYNNVLYIWNFPYVCRCYRCKILFKTYELP